jgi:hypothetical protein
VRDYGVGSAGLVYGQSAGFCEGTGGLSDSVISEDFLTS